MYQQNYLNTLSSCPIKLLSSHGRVLSCCLGTDPRTHEPTDGRTDRPSYRDAWTHPKMDMNPCILFCPSEKLKLSLVKSIYNIRHGYAISLPIQFLHLLRKFLMLNLLFLRRTVLTLDPMSVKVAFYQKIVLELPLQDLNLHQQDCLLCQSSI